MKKFNEIQDAFNRGFNAGKLHEQQRIIEILGNIDTNKPGEFGDGYKFAIQEALKALNQEK